MRNFCSLHVIHVQLHDKGILEQWQLIANMNKSFYKAFRYYFQKSEVF